MKDTEAARRALEVAVQQLGTNPALGERAERDRDQSQEAASFFLEMAAPTDTKKRDLLVRAAREGRPREVAPGSGRGSGRSGLGGAGGVWAMWMHGAHRLLMCPMCTTAIRPSSRRAPPSR